MTLFTVLFSMMLFTVYSESDVHPRVEDHITEESVIKEEHVTNKEDENKENEKKENDDMAEEDKKDEEVTTEVKGDESVEDGEFDIMLLNKKISNYLKAFDNIRKQNDDEVVQKVMTIVGQLITVSWIHTLKPDFRYVPRGGRALEDVRKDIIKELKEVDTVKPVSEAILIYSNGIEEEITEQFEVQRDYLNSRIEHIKEEFKKSVNVEEYQNLMNEFEESTKELDIIDQNIEIHKLASKMYLQTYISQFLQGSAINSDTFEVTSRNGKVKKSFPAPSLDSAIFMEVLHTEDSNTNHPN